MQLHSTMPRVSELHPTQMPSFIVCSFWQSRPARHWPPVHSANEWTGPLPRNAYRFDGMMTAKSPALAGDSTVTGLSPVSSENFTCTRAASGRRASASDK